jgi:chromosome partitioning protein
VQSRALLRRRGIRFVLQSRLEVGFEPVMPVIAVVNRKGGSGKSTLATHLAAYCANHGMSVLLGDADRQQSTQTWLKLRETQRLTAAPRIVGWQVDPKNVLRAPPGITHVVLDTPGGLRGFDLVRVVMLADAVLIPVCHSMFDRDSAAECFAELQAHPRVASGRCKVAAVGMRLDSRTKADESLRKWAGELELPYVGVLRETQNYVRCIERGLTLFDMPRAKVEDDLKQWQPILDWIAPVLNPPPRATEPVQRLTRPIIPSGSPPAGPARPVPTAKPAPAQPPVKRPVSASTADDLDSRFGFSTRIGRWLELLSVKRVRQRNS